MGGGITTEGRGTTADVRGITVIGCTTVKRERIARKTTGRAQGILNRDKKGPSQPWLDANSASLDLSSILEYLDCSDTSFLTSQGILFPFLAPASHVGKH